MKKSSFAKIVFGILTLAVATWALVLHQSPSRLPSAQSVGAGIRDVNLNNQFHRMSQMLREYNERQAEFERLLPEGMFDEKCSDSEIIDKEVNVLVKNTLSQRQNWKSSDQKKVASLMKSLDNVKKISRQMMQTCGVPASVNQLSELRSEIMTAGFIFQDLNNPF